jgi:hypothetical protein
VDRERAFAPSVLERVYVLDALTLLRQELKKGHGITEQAVADLSSDQLHHRAATSTIHSIATIYAHVVLAEDRLINGKLRRQPPLFVRGAWSEKIGIDAPSAGGDYESWAATVLNCDFEALRQYAKQVYSQTDDYLATLTESDLDGTVDFEGEVPVGTFLGSVIGWHAVQHSGEICALKGTLGGKGLPF